MIRVLAVAAGSLGAAGAALGATTVISAAPAAADVGCVPNFVCDVIPDQPRTFVNGIATSPQQFQQSIVEAPGQFLESVNPAVQIPRFLTGTCAGFEAPPVTDNETSCGVLNQPEFFLSNLASQPDTFLNDPEMGILNQPRTFINSITDPFGVDESNASGAPGDEE